MCSKLKKSFWPMKIKLEHRQSAYCESGTTANLLRCHGVNLSEPMVFGIGSGLFFTYLPFIKPNGAPLVSFRIYPGGIAKRLTRKLGIKVKFRTFRNADLGMAELDNALARGEVVGVVTGVFHLPYFPPEFRFHFNAHHLLVFGKQDNDYLVSDPIMQDTEIISAMALRKARFTKGEPALRGKMYTLTHLPGTFHFERAIVAAIKKTSHEMLYTPLPMCGVRGIRYLSKKLRQWPAKLSPDKAKLYLGQIIRMLEEIGTGGAGFRFIYAAFLQEASEILGHPWLCNASTEMAGIGDQWREFAYHATKKFKKHQQMEAHAYDELADQLLQLSGQEKRIFQRLKRVRQ